MASIPRCIVRAASRCRRRRSPSGRSRRTSPRVTSPARPLAATLRQGLGQGRLLPADGRRSARACRRHPRRRALRGRARARPQAGRGRRAPGPRVLLELGPSKAKPVIEELKKKTGETATTRALESLCGRSIRIDRKSCPRARSSRRRPQTLIAPLLPIPAMVEALQSITGGLEKKAMSCHRQCLSLSGQSGHGHAARLFRDQGG